MNAYKDIYEQYVDEASFLWVLRSIAVNQPHYNLSRIRELEQRIEAQLDGLMTSMEDAWGICLQALELGEPGEVFTATVIAFRSHDVSKIQKAIEVGLSNADATQGLISAMGWLPGKLVNAWIKKFYGSKDLDHKYLALAASSVRRENPAEQLNRILERDDCKLHINLYTRALRLIGELRRQDLLPHLTEATSSEQDDIRFWSIWSAILLGNHDAVVNLEPYVFQAGPHQALAVNTAFKVLSVDQARDWIARLSSDKEQARIMIKAIGILGDPHAVNWLIVKMQEPLFAKLSAEAFTLITGIDLDQNQLVSETPPVLALHPNEDAEDDDVSLDEDDNLPWPDTDKVAAFWETIGSNFIDGQRYFLGQQISSQSLQGALVSAGQRQRHLAALELALIDSTIPMQNTRSMVAG